LKRTKEVNSKLVKAKRAHLEWKQILLAGQQQYRKLFVPFAKSFSKQNKI